MCGISVIGGTAIWSFSLFGPGESELNGLSFLNINDITINAVTPNAGQVTVISAGRTEINIDNSTIRNSCKEDYASYVLLYGGCQVSVRNSLLESLSLLQLADLGPTLDDNSLKENSWIIAEASSIEDLDNNTRARLRLHNVSLSAHGSQDRGSNFIITNAPASDNRILLDSVYMYSNSNSAYCYSLVNMSTVNPAVYYATGTVISCGSIPTANYGLAWMGYPASVTSSSLVQWNLRDAHAPRPY